MKPLTGVVALCLVATIPSLSAQQLERFIETSPPEPQPMETASVPEHGTFYMLSDFLNDHAPPPYPMIPCEAAQVYSTGADETYIVDDSQALPRTPNVLAIHSWQIEAMLNVSNQISDSHLERLADSRQRVQRDIDDPALHLSQIFITKRGTFGQALLTPAAFPSKTADILPNDPAMRDCHRP